MKLKIFAATALIAVGALGSASAADLGVAPLYHAPPPPPPVYNWTGWYVGGGGGYACWQPDRLPYCWGHGGHGFADEWRKRLVRPGSGWLRLPVHGTLVWRADSYWRLRRF